jgi:hypothetical protein
MSNTTMKVHVLHPKVRSCVGMVSFSLIDRQERQLPYQLLCVETIPGSWQRVFQAASRLLHHQEISQSRDEFFRSTICMAGVTRADAMLTSGSSLALLTSTRWPLADIEAECHRR